MSEKDITCIVCPIGCVITVHGDGDSIESIEGFTCARGEKYARDEFVNPLRILTSTAKVEGAASAPLVPLRSSKPMPKGLLFACMAEIKKLDLRAPIQLHEVLIPDVLGSGVDIIATLGVE